MRVAFVQFMKRDGEAGEQAFLRNLLGGNFLAPGEGFFRREEERPRHRLQPAVPLTGQKDDSGRWISLLPTRYSMPWENNSCRKKILKFCFNRQERPTPILSFPAEDFPTHSRQRWI